MCKIISFTQAFRGRGRRFGLLLLLVALVGIDCFGVQASVRRIPEKYKTIQAAIDAANPGDTVLVAHGVYFERLILKPYVIIKSAGNDALGEIGLKRAEATILNGGGEQGEGPGVQMAEGAKIDGFTITNVGRFDGPKWRKHYATRGDNQSHEHIGQPGTPGIAVGAVTCTVVNNIVHHIGYTGIAVVGVEGEVGFPHILRNICYSNMGGGIGAMNGSTALIESNICFKNFYAGIGHNNASPLVINNRCYENIRAGIGISEGSKPIVRGNLCYRNRRAGIGIRTGAITQPIVEDNDCYENGMAGIGVRDDAAPIIRNNRCYRNEMAGIGSQGGAQPIIVGNEIYENELAGIGQADDTQTILISNHIHHNDEAGIGFEAGAGGVATVVGNRVNDNAMVAVGVNEGWRVRLIDNVLSRNGGVPPIVMVFADAEAEILGNTIKGSGVAGVRVGGRVRVNDNKFVGVQTRKSPPSNAVWGLEGSKVTMSDNVVKGWRYALSSKRGAVTASGNRVSNYGAIGMKIDESTTPAHIFDNRFVGDDKKSPVSINGKAGFIEGNKVEASKGDAIN